MHNICPTLAPSPTVTALSKEISLPPHLRTKTRYAAFPQLKEISFKMTITLGGGVNINCIYYSIVSKFLGLFVCQIPSPYHDSHMQINCGSPEGMCNFALA